MILDVVNLFVVKPLKILFWPFLVRWSYRFNHWTWLYGFPAWMRRLRVYLEHRGEERR